MRPHRYVAWLAWGGLVAACSSSSPSVGPTSGVDAGDLDAGYPRYLTDLTQSERDQLCDWTAAIGGGYGTSTVCDGGLVVSNFADQQACLDAFLGACSTVTVSDWEACRNVEVSDPCALALYTAPECATVARCLGKTDGGPAPEPEGGTD
jgi:hypothetical protein